MGAVPVSTDEIARDRVEALALALKDHRVESKDRTDRLEGKIDALTGPDGQIAKLAASVNTLVAQGGMIAIITEPKRVGAITMLLIALLGGGVGARYAMAQLPTALAPTVVPGTTSADAP